MLQWLKTRWCTHHTASLLYDRIVAQARQPAFYLDFGVPDTVSGRFEMIVLHLFIVLERLRADPETPNDPGQQLVETFFATLDHEMREMGVGDMAVPKKMQKAAGGFYGRIQAYADAVRDDDPAVLTTALERNVFDDNQGSHGRPHALAIYARCALRAVGSQSIDDLLEGWLRFPDPLASEKGAS